MPKLRTIWLDTRGATAIEYGLLVAIVSIGLIASASFMSDETIAMWRQVSSSVTGAS